MDNIRLVFAVLILLGVVGSAVGEGQDTERRKFVYCKAENLRYEETALVCNFGNTESKGCTGWQHGRIDRRDVVDVVSDYKQCSNGKWLARIEVR